MPIEITLNADETASLLMDGNIIGVIKFVRPHEESALVGVFYDHDLSEDYGTYYCDKCDGKDEALATAADAMVKLGKKHPKIAKELAQIRRKMR